MEPTAPKPLDRRNLFGLTDLALDIFPERGDVKTAQHRGPDIGEIDPVVHVDTDYPTSMGELVTVGHTAIVHACKIDNEVLVGMGATILDDVEVGARSIIGANALVTIGTKIPPGSLVLGSPAKIRRQLTLDEQKDIARWAWSYVETAKQYREFY